MATTGHDQALLEHLACGNAPPQPADYDEIITGLARELVRRRAASDAIAIGLSVLEPWAAKPLNQLGNRQVCVAIGAIAHANKVARDG